MLHDERHLLSSIRNKEMQNSIVRDAAYRYLSGEVNQTYTYKPRAGDSVFQQLSNYGSIAVAAVRNLRQLQSAFYQLPPEIRNLIIYEYILPRNAKLISFDSQRTFKASLHDYHQLTIVSKAIERKAEALDQWERPIIHQVNSLSLTCRLAYEETMPALYHNNTFRTYDSTSLQALITPFPAIPSTHIHRLRIDKVFILDRAKPHESGSQHRTTYDLTRADEHIDTDLLGMIKQLPNLEQLQFRDCQGRGRLRSPQAALELVQLLDKLGKALKHLNLITIDTWLPLTSYLLGKDHARKLHYMGSCPPWQRWFERYEDFYDVQTGPFDENAIMRFEPM